MKKKINRLVLVRVANRGKEQKIEANCLKKLLFISLKVLLSKKNFFLFFF